MMLRKAAKAGFFLADRFRSAFSGPRILIYHQIGAGHGLQMDVHPDQFEIQLDWLTEAGREVVPLEEAIMRRAEPTSDNLVVLTFDDGYADMHLNGFELLLERQLPFTLYITTGPIESQIGLSPERQSTPITWDQINDMASSNLMTIAAHTHVHADLRFVDHDEILQDLTTSDDLIAARTGVQPEHFAYPWGYWSAAADKVVRTRYKSAVLGGGQSISGATDPFVLNRIPIQLSDGLRSFRSKIERGQRSEEFVRRRISGYDGP